MQLQSLNRHISIPQQSHGYNEPVDHQSQTGSYDVIEHKGKEKMCMHSIWGEKTDVIFCINTYHLYLGTHAFIQMYICTGNV